MARVTPQEYADKWQRRLSGAGEDIRKGIAKVTVAPGIAAAAAQDLMAQNTMAAITSGKWARRTAAVPLQAWKDAASNKGVARVAQGAQAAQAKMAATAQWLLPAVDAAAAAANALPKGGIENSIARAAAFMRNMSDAAANR